jgi:hypothetical protein
MRRLIYLLIFLTACTSKEIQTREKINLAGEWQFMIDSLDRGIEENWCNEPFTDKVNLPGSMAENGKGNEVTVNTPWVGDIVDKSYFTDIKYEKYRQPGNIKIPFWLKPVKYYKGVAWYRRDFDLSETSDGKRIFLFLERCHWESTVFINGLKAGSSNSLSAPHEFDITSLVKKGSNSVAVRIDNRIIVPIGVNSHSISDHTQSNWNGITGDISIRVVPTVFIGDVKVFPDIKNKMAKVIVSINNPDNDEFDGELKIRAASFNSNKRQKVKSKTTPVSTKSDELQLVVDYEINSPLLWSEFNPALYKLTLTLSRNNSEIIDTRTVDFGMREFRTRGTRFEVNGVPVFLRGTTECCIFPLTGYPPSDTDSWIKVLKTCKDYGLNHVRFHSFCPPEAAFIAADRLGIYFHVECSSWANQGTSIGAGGEVDRFIYAEGDRILKEYGNHPSFCMMAYGNEPAGSNQYIFLGKLIEYWKSKDTRRVYTSAAGWPIIAENEYHLSPEPRIQHWDEGLKSVINARPPQTRFNFNNEISKYNVPMVGHEIGQWCVYPDFREIEKYTGVLKATNFEIFRESLNANNMGDQAEDFLKASGKLQVLCYKADIEAALRTQGYAGFEMLQLHDFPGQGTALVGILNPFFESKGYVTPEEFRMFCNSTVPLVKLRKMIFTSEESLTTAIGVAHFGPEPLRNVYVVSKLIDNQGKVLASDSTLNREIKIGNTEQAAVFSTELKDIITPSKLTLEVLLRGTPFRNRWNIWVYPAEGEVNVGKILVTDKLDRDAEKILNAGGSVLFLPHGKIASEKGAGVAIGFSSIFWNTAWTNNQAPHTLGILCNPEHHLFDSFPTEYHSNWQWWDPVAHSQAMILDDFPTELRPLIQPIDTWFENRRLALAFEVRCGKGKILVCSIDMMKISKERLPSKQLYSSIINYMNSEAFNPETSVEIKKLKELVSP